MVTWAFVVVTGAFDVVTGALDVVTGALVVVTGAFDWRLGHPVMVDIAMTETSKW